MTRDEAFKEVARAATALAKLASQQKDTVDWWTQYGEEYQHLQDAFLVASPKKSTHRRAAMAAMLLVSPTAPAVESGSQP